MPDISLMGAVYPDVPAVTLPVDGGGTARFTDVSGTTATDSDVASGKVYFKADGSQSTGTASGGSANIQSLSVSQNGTYTAPTGVDGYSPVTVNVSGGGGAVAPKEVNLIDYDGTVLHAYSVAEFQQLNAMPSNPSHTGLTAQGWNWSLTDAKAQLTAMPDAGLTIGQMYVTDDGKTRIYVHFEEGRCSPFLGICPKGTVTIDWGDGSATETLTGTSLTTVKTALHNYQPGEYVIKLSVTGTDTFAIYGGSASYSRLLQKTASGTGTASRVYLNSIRKVELGSGVSIGQYAFNYCGSMDSITIPSGTSIGNYAFYYCFNLKSIVIPSGATTTGEYAFCYCQTMLYIAIPKTVTSAAKSSFSNAVAIKAVSLPSGVTSIAQGGFNTVCSLSSIVIPSSVTSFGNSAFSGCFGLAVIRFLRTTAPTVSNSNAWSSIPTDCLMLVPYAGLASYLSASNYPAKASYTYLGYATYASGATLPTKDSTEAYNVTWYASKDDAKAGTNAISTGNGSEIYCTYAAV